MLQFPITLQEGGQIVLVDEDGPPFWEGSICGTGFYADQSIAQYFVRRNLPEAERAFAVSAIREYSRQGPMMEVLNIAIACIDECRDMTVDPDEAVDVGYFESESDYLRDSLQSGKITDRNTYRHLEALRVLLAANASHLKMEADSDRTDRRVPYILFPSVQDDLLRKRDELSNCWARLLRLDLINPNMTSEATSTGYVKPNHFIDTDTAARRLNRSKETIRRQCRRSIPPFDKAEIHAGKWLIPEDVVPLDRKMTADAQKLPPTHK